MDITFVHPHHGKDRCRRSKELLRSHSGMPFQKLIPRGQRSTMSMNDPISDMLTRVRKRATAPGHRPRGHSWLNSRVKRCHRRASFKDEGFIDSTTSVHADGRQGEGDDPHLRSSTARTRSAALAGLDSGQSSLRASAATCAWRRNPPRPRRPRHHGDLHLARASSRAVRMPASAVHRRRSSFAPSGNSQAISPRRFPAKRKRHHVTNRQRLPISRSPRASRRHHSVSGRQSSPSKGPKGTLSPSRCTAAAINVKIEGDVPQLVQRARRARRAR